MKKALRNTLFGGISIAILAGCTGNNLDVAKYQTRINGKVQIPEVCQTKYKSVMPTVAVMEFNNNSTFGKADIDQTDGSLQATKQSAAIAGIVAGPAGVGVGAASASKLDAKSKTTNVKRSVDAKISESITGPLESLIVTSGGAKLFSRADMDKVDAELKFQDSGLVDPDSAAQFGKLSGVKFIITGSLDNVEQKYRNNEAAAKGVANMTKHSDNNAVKLLGALAQMGASMTDGMIITTKMTVKMIDVETGKIVFSKQLESSGNIGKIPEPTYDQVIGGIKSAMLESIPELNKDFADYFAVKGYITQLKTDGKEYIAQVNIGRDAKVVENQVFDTYNFEQVEDPMTGAITCDVTQTPVQLRASQQIQENATWATVEKGDGSMLKLGQLVRKSHEKAGFALPKLPF